MSIIKYPRTFHVPNSGTVASDDKKHRDLAHYAGMDVVITEKMDGECTTLYHDYMHARSRTYAAHPSRDWLKRKHGEIGYLIPEGMRVCGEDLYAEHSIPYSDLLSYFYVFSVWDEDNRALSWDDTETWASLLGFPTVPVLYRGEFSQDVVDALPKKLDLSRQEGFVIRPSSSFAFEEFGLLVSKWVRPGHVQTDEHWMDKPVVVNGLRHDAQDYTPGF